MCVNKRLYNVDAWLLHFSYLLSNSLWLPVLFLFYDFYREFKNQLCLKVISCKYFYKSREYTFYVCIVVGIFKEMKAFLEISTFYEFMKVKARSERSALESSY